MPSKTNKVTLQDVADLAGVSLKTASNVKNEWPYVSDQVRARVKSAMETLGYRPSHIARSLATGKSDTIGVIVPDISNPFFSSAFRGCEDTLSAQGYSAYLCNIDEDVEKEKYYINLLVEQGVDGLLLWGSQLEAEEIEKVLTDAVPTVSIDGVAESGPANLSLIQVENYQGARQAVAHLIEKGYRTVAHIAGMRQRLPARQRLAAYRDVLAENAIDYRPELVVEAWPSIGGGYFAGLELLENQKPDAVFCYNDLTAIGLLTVAEERGLVVPDDLAIVGFDDILPAALVSPMLTTVSINQYELGCFAANQVLSQIASPSQASRQLAFPAELVIRESSQKQRFSIEERRALLKKIASSPSANLTARKKS